MNHSSTAGCDLLATMLTELLQFLFSEKLLFLPLFLRDHRLQTAIAFSTGYFTACWHFGDGIAGCSVLVMPETRPVLWWHGPTGTLI